MENRKFQNGDYIKLKDDANPTEEWCGYDEEEINKDRIYKVTGLGKAVDNQCNYVGLAYTFLKSRKYQLTMEKDILEKYFEITKLGDRTEFEEFLKLQDEYFKLYNKFKDSIWLA